MGWLVRGSRVALIGLLAMCWLAAGCTGEDVGAGGDGAGTGAGTGAGAGAGGVDRLQPLTALGPCTAPDLVADPSADDVDGLILPDRATITSVVAQDPLTTVEGWVPATPLQVQAGYADLPDLEIITLEDEVWESETLVADGEHRLFVKVQAVCEAGSVFLVVVAPDDQAGALPVPAGG